VVTAAVATLAVAWAAVAASAASSLLSRRANRRPAAPAAAGPRPARPAVAAARRHPPVTALGAAVRRLATAAGPTASAGAVLGARPAPSTGASDQRELDRRTGWATVAAAGLLVVAPVLALVPVLWVTVAPALAARRARAAHEARLLDQIPDVVDLLALTTVAGLPAGAAIVAIGDRPGGPLGEAMARAAGRLGRGASTAEALDALRAVGPAARPLLDALLQHDRYGTPLLPALERVAIEARARRRRRAEEAARRLPVVLLFPLVLTTLPAFVLLTVVPLLAGSLGSLSLSPT
jgi:Flp pilus assembly protein TadB